MEEKTTVSKIGLRYGIIAGLVLIIYSLILQLLGMATNKALGYITYVFLIVIVVLAHKAYKENGDGYMTLGQGLGIGMLISLISGVFSGIFSYIYLKFIDDSMIAQMMDMQIEAMEKQGLDDKTIEQAMEMTEKFMTPELIPLFAVIGMLFFGFIISLIVSLFTKKANPSLEI